MISAMIASTLPGRHQGLGAAWSSTPG
jgi:hypothetical protein